MFQIVGAELFAAREHWICFGRHPRPRLLSSPVTPLSRFVLVESLETVVSHVSMSVFRTIGLPSG